MTEAVKTACIKCGKEFKGFGTTCAECRRSGLKSKGTAKACDVCGAFFTGFGSTCEDCTKAGATPPPPSRIPVVPPSHLVQLAKVQVDELKRTVKCEVLTPLDPKDAKAYLEARQVWNLDSSGFPQAIVNAQTTEDISAAVKFAKAHSLQICVRSGGAHSSHAMVDECLCINLNLMRQVTIAEGIAECGAGATIGDVDDACAPHGLALPMGHVHHTGVAGMLLNASSGIGYLGRTRGLTGSWLLEATMVLADGSVVVVNEKENSDLFWGLPGAGANFGIATRLKFRLTKITSTVLAGDVVRFAKGEGPPGAASELSRCELVKQWLDFFQMAPRECNALIVLPAKGPVVGRIVYVPQEKQVEEDAAAAAAEGGGAAAAEPPSIAHGRKAFEGILSAAPNFVNAAGPTNYYAGLQKLANFPPSFYFQRGGTVVKDLPDEVVSQLCDQAANCPTGGNSAIIFTVVQGKLSEMKTDELPTAEVFSRTKWWVIIVADFPEGKAKPEVRDQAIQWVLNTYAILKSYCVDDRDNNGARTRFSIGGQAAGYAQESFGGIWGSNTDRLRELKKLYDADNFFKLNRNLKPAA